MNHRRIFITALLLMLTAVSFMAKVWTEPFITIESIDAGKQFPLVSIKVTVNTKYHAVPGKLDEDHFQVFENGFNIPFRVAPIDQSNEYLSLVFVFDSSKNIRRDHREIQKGQASSIIRKTAPQDTVALYQFDDEVTLKNNFTTNREIISTRINTIEQRGRRSVLYDALYDSLNLMADVKKPNRRLLCFTDGRDDGSSVRPDDIIEFSRKYSIPIFFFTPPGTRIPDAVSRIARMTGGALFSGKHAGDDAVSQIFQTRTRKYMIQYQSMIKGDGGRHAIEVRFRHQDIRDQSVTEFQVPVKERFGRFIGENLFVFISLAFLGVMTALFVLLLRREHPAHPGIRERESFIEQRSAFGTSRDTGRSEIESRSERDVLEDVPRSVTDDSDKDVPKGKPSAFLMKKNDGGGTERIILSGLEIIFGSDSSCGITVDNNAVSGQHAKIKYMGDGYVLMDMVSSSGTFLNDRKLLRPRRLFDWDEIRIGSTVFVFRNFLKPPTETSTE